MYKYYLTYQFAVSFQRSCCLLEIEEPRKSELVHSSTLMLNQFARAVRCDSNADKLKHFCVAFLCLLDCKEAVDRSGVKPIALSGYSILHARLEQICESLSRAEHGQLRLLA